MDESIGDFIVAPFRDLVAQGRIAGSNADNAKKDDMRTLAQSLVKEGERALKRLEPLCQKKCVDFGAVFVNAVKDDEEISHHVEILNDLLYDFEEFVEAENFDAERFLELQACSRKAAPIVLHRITRLKFPSPADERPGTITPPLSPSRPTLLIRQPSDDSSLEHVQSLQNLDDTRGDKRSKYPMPCSPGQDHKVQQVEPPIPRTLPPVREEGDSPTLPLLLDPWSQRSQDIEQGLQLITKRREHTSDSEDLAIGSSANSEYTYSPTITGQTKSSQPPVPPRSPRRIVTPTMRGPTLEQTANFIRSHYGRESISPISPRPNRDSASSSVNTSIQSSLSDYHSFERDSYLGVASPVSPRDQASDSSLDSHFRDLNQGKTPSRTQSPHGRPLFSQPNSPLSATHESEGMEPIVLPAPEIPDGLMLAEEDAAQDSWPSWTPTVQLGSCAVSLQSSYYRFGGFCRGAMDIIQGGLGIKHIKKQGLAVASIEVAKCKACAYELEWKAVERDLNNEATENLTSESIGFRLRFLSKSHIPSKNAGEPIYGCLFCIQQRHTTHPNDATVFFGQRQLFSHLARHPQPVPHVPGLTVVQSDEVPSYFANNYDLHFREQPRPSNLSHMMRELTAFPIANALQTCRPSQSSATKRPPDGEDVLFFATGARVVGIEFPDKYEGQWCVGWADHQHGLIPADAIRLEAPQGDSSLEQGSSSLQAVARWKFVVKDSKEVKTGEWLPFNKGEVLTNVGWSHQGHWCWSGTNSKGRFGLFPRSFIEPGTLTEAEAKPDHVDIASKERRPGLLSRITIRHRSMSGDGGGSGGSSLPRASIT